MKGESGSDPAFERVGPRWQACRVPITDLNEWLATHDADALERVVTLRPDALRGAPVRDRDDLAERLAHPASVIAILRELPGPGLQVLEAVGALGVGARLDRLTGFLRPRALDPDRHPADVEYWVAYLVDRCLLWPDGAGRLRLNPGVRALLPTPLGLGRSAEAVVSEVPAQDLQKVLRRWGREVPRRKVEAVDAVLGALGDPAEVRRIVGDAPPGVTATLLDLAREAAARMGTDPDPEGELPMFLQDQDLYRRHRAAMTWASENGLAFGSAWEPVGAELPSEVLLALAPPEARAPFDPEPPAPATAAVAQQQVEATASGAVSELLATVMATLEHVSRSPVAALKSGGIGVRELNRLAKVVGGEVADVRLALELGVGLGLLAAADGGGLGTHARFGRWRGLPPARRVAELVQTWAGLHYVPTADRGQDGKALPALVRIDEGDAGPAARAVMFGLLGDLPDGTGMTSVELLRDAAVWNLPIVVGMADASVVPTTLAEAERLGLVALGRLTAPGRLLVGGWATDELTEAFAPLLPEVQSTAILGSDLTAVVIGSPSAAVVDLLDRVAEREGRGRASTWRFTPTAVRGALDAGLAVADVLAGLRRLSAGDLPQTLEYLVQDVGRRHGHLQVRPAGAVVVGQDEALVAEVAASSTLRRIGLHAVAPTVLAAAAPVEDVLVALRAAGYLPVETGVDGVPVVELRRIGDTPGRPGGAGAAPGGEAGRGDAESDTAVLGDLGEACARLEAGEPLDDADAALAQWVAELGDDGTHPHPHADPELPAPPPESPADVAARLVSGEVVPPSSATISLAEQIGRTARRLRAGAIDQLAYAVVYELPVQIRYRSSSGRETVRAVSELHVEGGYLFGWCHLRQDSRYFSLSNILDVAPASYR